MMMGPFYHCGCGLITVSKKQSIGDLPCPQCGGLCVYPEKSGCSLPQRNAVERLDHYELLNETDEALQNHRHRLERNLRLCELAIKEHEKNVNKFLG